jgi:YD repeat-containing protein
VHSTDGTKLSFTEINGEYRCIEVKDRNGNYITINYNSLGRITSLIDTLGRVIVFNYDGNANLLSITQAWNGQPSHQWVSFGWGTRTMQSSFTSGAVVGTANNVVLPVLTQVAMNDTSYFTFDYTNSLQVSQIKNYFGATERNALTFTYETPAGDVPRLLDSRVSARNWTGLNGVPTQVVTTYSVGGDGACVLTAPDGTIYKEYYGTGWQRGLTSLSEVWSGGVRQKWTTTAWTQDNTSVGYEVNPRVTETNVYDASGNRRRVVIDYGSYAQYGLPYGVHEYAANGMTEIRQTYTDLEWKPVANQDHLRLRRCGASAGRAGSGDAARHQLQPVLNCARQCNRGVSLGRD